MLESGEDSLAINLDGAVWVPYKELFSIVSSAIYRKDERSIQDLESTLRTYKMDFLSLLKNPAKRIQSREMVKKAVTDGIRIQGQQGMRILPQAVIDEAMIVSDLFDLNEVVALELLLTGESQQPRLSTTTRGLAAVLLYYDGRRCLVNALRALIQARKGRCWTLDLAPEVVDLATKFTDDLWNDGLRDQLMGHLLSFSPDEERNRLEASRALGDPKHRKQITDLIEEIHVSLAECIYCWSCQSGLPKTDVIQVLSALSNMVPSRGDGMLDGAQFTLLLAVLYSLDVGVLDSANDLTEHIESLPLLRDPSFVAAVHKEVTGPNQWKYSALKAVVQFAWGISLRTISQLPISHGSHQQFFEEDEMVIDLALDGGALRFLCTSVVGNSCFTTEEFFVRRIHSIVTDFIVNFPLKLKELRNQGDEIARIIAHGEWSPEDATPVHFSEFLQLITALYAKDPLNLKLGREFWCPADALEGGRSVTYFGPTQKQVNLYKFIRLSGDLLPPLLYVPYIRMLTSLASNSPVCARNCFILLKTNGTMSGGHYGIVSWDHFFGSLQRYLTSLRQEQSIHAQRSMSPQELEALTTFLTLTETIASQDDISRHSLAESGDWNTLFVFVGLLGCGIPIVLKARIVETLAAFSKSTEVAVFLWQSLETNQILPSSVDLSQKAHAQVELDEVESRNEEYPLTRAFLKLLYVLVETFTALDISDKLTSRFDACILFVINDVLSKFNSRSYKYVEEKWQIACDCIEFLLKLVLQSELAPNIMQSSSSSSVKKPSGGGLILSYLLQDTRLFRTILYIVDEASKMLSLYAPFTGKQMLEKCSLLSLKLLQSTLERQDSFLASVREVPYDVVVAGIHQLLMGINPQSGQADYVVRIAKFTNFNDSLPEHAFYAVSILFCMCRSSVSQEQIIGSVFLKREEAAALQRGFVECLEVEDSDISADVDWSLPTVVDGSNESQIRSSTRRSILRLLIYCLHIPPPNVSLFFLGFDLHNPMHKTVLQCPGVLGSPYTCLHAVLEILFRGPGGELSTTLELCQELIYTLCATSATSGPTVRYLRSSHDYLFRQLKLIPVVGIKDDVSCLNWQTWLLKTVAIEVRLCSAYGQRSSLQRLASILLNDKGSKSGVTDSIPLDVSPARCLILVILDHLNFGQTFPVSPQWEFFDSAVLEQVIASCERQSAAGYLAVDVKRLHRFLLSEVGNLHGALTLGQRPLVTEEMRAILAYVVNRNRVRRSLHSKRMALESWQILTEAVLVSFPCDGSRDVTVILEIIHSLLQKILADSTLPELTQQASRVLLTLTASLRQCFLTEGVLPSQGNLRPTWSPFVSSLQTVLRGLIECVIQAGTSPLKVRANYYGALLNLLRLADGISSISSHVALSATSNEHQMERDRFISNCVEIINSYGNGFLEILCRDACNTNYITKMLSLCCLSVLVSNDSRNAFLHFVSTNGYLLDLVNGLKGDDKNLQAILLSRATSLRALYVYETKMAFFTHLSSSVNGAQLLLCNDFLGRLAEMQSLSMKPDIARSQTESVDVTDSVVNHYFQVLIPALKISLLLLMSPVGNALDARSQVMNLLVSNADCFGGLLREGTFIQSRMNDYAIISSVFSRCFIGIEDLTGLESSADVRSQLSRLWRLVQDLLPSLVASKRTALKGRQRLELLSRGEQSFVEDVGWSKAVMNLLSFCVSMTQVTENGVPLLTFGPSLSSDESVTRDRVRGIHSLPDLGLLTFLLKYCSEILLQTCRSRAESSQVVGTESIDEGDFSQSQTIVFGIVEHSLFLLYFHLDFYIVRVSSFRQFGTLRREAHPSEIRIRRLQEISPPRIEGTDVASSSVSDASRGALALSKDEAVGLQTNCRKILSEAHLENILDVSKTLGSSKQNRFVSAMIRRLRWVTSIHLE